MMAPPRTPLEIRFWPKVDQRGPAECWPWLASKANGYGRIGAGGAGTSPLLAHRVSYELLVGPIPAGLEIDHLCRNPSCVNPAHLEPVTHRENDLRGVGISAINAAKTHCANGHPFDAVNTRDATGKITPGGYRRGRECRGCDRDRYYAKQARLKGE